VQPASSPRPQASRPAARREREVVVADMGRG
jgi:hypothetical protein